MKSKKINSNSILFGAPPFRAPMTRYTISLGGSMALWPPWLHLNRLGGNIFVFII